MTHATLRISYARLPMWPLYLPPLALGLHPWAWLPLGLCWLLLRLRPQRIALRLPQGWAELRGRRARRRVLNAMLLHELGAITPTRLLLECLRRACGIPRWAWLYLRPQAVAEQLMPAVEWVAAMPLTATWQPVVWLGWRRWLLPRPEADDITLSHYLQAEAALREAAAAQDWAVFLAAFVTPARTGLHWLLPAPTPHSRAQAYKLLRRATAMQAYYVLAYYQAMRSALRQQYPDAFTPADSGGPASDAAPDVAAVLAALAQAGELGTPQQVADMPARVFLAWADSKRRQQREAEARRLQDLIRANHQKFVA